MNNINTGETIGALIVAILTTLICIAFGWCLWGEIMVSVLGLPKLTFLQFCELYALCSILFGHPSSRVNNTNNRRED